MLHDVYCTHFIPPGLFLYSGSAFTPVPTASIWYMTRSASDNPFWLYIPLFIEGSSRTSRIAKLQSLLFYYKIDTLACSTIDTNIYTVLPGVNGVAPVATARGASYDTAHNSNALRCAVGNHTMQIAPATGNFWLSSLAGHLAFYCLPAATTAFTFLGARIFYTLRL